MCLECAQGMYNTEGTVVICCKKMSSVEKFVLQQSCESCVDNNFADEEGSIVCKHCLPFRALWQCYVC